jgi:hypothetical protein
MIINHINGTKGEWTPHLQKRRISDDKSSYHLACRGLLKEIFPTVVILEEVTIPINPREISYLDFYIPVNNLAIEVHGSQHYTFNAHFHKDFRDLIYQKNKDKKKLEWCSINKILLIELKYKEEELWKAQILSMTAAKK